MYTAQQKLQAQKCDDGGERWVGGGESSAFCLICASFSFGYGSETLDCVLGKNIVVYFFVLSLSGPTIFVGALCHTPLLLGTRGSRAQCYPARLSRSEKGKIIRRHSVLLLPRIVLRVSESDRETFELPP